MKTTRVLPDLRYLWVVAWAAFQLEAAEPTTSNGPAQVVGKVSEAELATIILTPRAEERLALRTVRVEERDMRRTRMFPGEIILPLVESMPGNSGLKSSVFWMKPPVTPDARVQLVKSQLDADGEVEKARIRLETTGVVLARSQQLLGDKAGSARAVDEAEADVKLAETDLRTAQAKRDFLGPSLLETARQGRLWVRVPVYAGDLPRIRTDLDATAVGLARKPGATQQAVKPIPAPPSANPEAATIDLFYQLKDDSAGFRLGERVGVNIILTDEERSSVIPWSAVVHDVNGGAWVYENIEPRKYARRRVQVKFVVDGVAALSNGPKPGTKIVSEGVAELFGTEFGVGK